MQPPRRAPMAAPRRPGQPTRISTFSSSALVSRESERPATWFKSGRGTTFAILEARNAIGGTWDLFRYPGIRSDSDMSTFGYAFRPWDDTRAIADGPSILRYLAETAKEYGVDRRIRFGCKVVRASWRSADARWGLDVDGPDGEALRFSCNFLFLCTGYYEYAEGYMPGWPGMERFAGPIVHPQTWPEDLRYDGKRVVVIGSGATAVTIVPAMAERAAHVVMLQRSPTYVVARPAEEAIAKRLGRWLPARLTHAVVRWKNILLQMYLYRLSRRKPAAVRAQIIKLAQAEVGPEFDAAEYFNPRYEPWDQRMCLVPGRGPVRRDARGQGVDRQRRDRNLHRDRPAS